MNCYNLFADFYNRFMDCDYDKWSQFLVNHGCAGSGADLACGTGNITFRLADAGCDVTGFDISESMLAVAESLKKNQKNPVFVRQSLTDFNAFGKYDFVTCVCDGINYLKSTSEVKKTFQKVYASLKKGGVFIFDVSSEYKIKNILADNVFFEDDDDVTYFWRNSLSKNKVQMDLTFFVKKGELYDRFDETHFQYAYSEETLKNLLGKIGFKNIKTFDCYTQNKPKKTSERVVFTAKKSE